MANEPIPVYVFTGFLESGKTKFIQDILADPNFTENERTVLLLCEEGIEEYDEKWLLHYGTALVPIESEDRLTPNILKRHVEAGKADAGISCPLGAVPDRHHGRCDHV